VIHLVACWFGSWLITLYNPYGKLHLEPRLLKNRAGTVVLYCITKPDSLTKLAKNNLISQTQDETASLISGGLFAESSDGSSRLEALYKRVWY